MLTAVDDIWTKGTYIVFRNIGHIGKRKTLTWEVRSGSLLGHVEWFSRWRKYSFFPMEETVYEQTCLREIAEFCETQTKAYKHK